MTIHHPEIIFSVISTSCCLFLFFLLLMRFRSRGAIDFIAVVLAIGLWQVGKIFKNLPLILPLEFDIAFWSDVSFIGVTFIYSTFFRMACRISFRNRGMYLIISIFGFATSLLFIFLEIKGVLTCGLRETQYGYFHIPSIYYSLYMLNYFLFMAGATFLFYPRYYRKVPQLKKQAAAVFYAAIAGFLLGSLEFVSIWFTPLFPVADLSPCVFGGVLYWAIYRFNVIRGSDLVKATLLRVAYLVLLFLLAFVIFHLSSLVVKTLHFPARNLFLISAFALLVFILTPMYLLILRKIKQKFFPVGSSYSKLSTFFSSHLSTMDTPDKMFSYVIDKMEQEFSYHHGTAVVFQLRNSQSDTSKFSIIGKKLSHRIQPVFFNGRKYPCILSRPQILEKLRLSKFTPTDKHHILMQLRQLNRLEADLLLPVSSQGELLGVLLFSHKSIPVENWEEVSSLLTSLITLLGNHVYQLDLLKTASEQEHLSKVGTMAASLAHEIKNPLEGIFGAAQLLNEGIEDQGKFINIILKDTARLNDVVLQFLQFSKYFIPQVSPFELCRFAQEFIDQQTAIKGSILLKTQEKALHVTSDKNGLRQILVNLIQNASRYQIADKPIIMTLVKDGKSLKISVEDNGPGIKEDDRDKIFEPFFTTSAKGTGLGLAISQKIARAMGGDLYFEPLSPGSRFVLVISEL